MPVPSRFFNGLSVSKRTTFLGNMPVPVSPVEVHYLYDEFDTYLTGAYTETKSTGTIALVAGDGGLLLLTTAAGAGDTTAITSPAGGWVIGPTQPFWFGAKFLAADVSGPAFQIGVIAGTVATPTDGIYFTKAAGATTAVLNCLVSSVSQFSLAFPTSLVNSTAVTWGFEYRPYAASGTAEVYVYVNDALVARQTGLLAANIPTANLSRSVAVVQGGTGAKTLTLDWMLAVDQRR